MAANMDQGDAANALLPIDFDTIDWSLLEDDWDSCRQDHFLLSAWQPANGSQLSQSSQPSQPSQPPNLQLSHFHSSPTNLQQLGIGTFEPWMFVTRDPALCIPDNFNPHLTVERRHPEARDVSETIWSADNIWGTLREDGNFPLPLETSFVNPLASEVTIPQDGQHGLQSLSTASSTGEPIRNMSTAMPRARPRTSKPRLPCTHPGCKSTFPRKYELNRHQSNVHKRNVSVSCPVYGCNRTAKPFGRLDKFREHFRKHRSSDNFLCLIEDCHAGPFTLHLLAEHLATAHIHDHPQSANLYDVMQTVSPDVLGRGGLFRVAQKQQEGKDICPLAAIGCRFRLSILESNMSLHMYRTHMNLCDRVGFYDAWIAFGFKYPLQGAICSCPICPPTDLLDLTSFLAHLHRHHSKINRQKYAKELVEMFGPYPSDNPALLTCQRCILENSSENREAWHRLGLSIYQLIPRSLV